MKATKGRFTLQKLLCTIHVQRLVNACAFFINLTRFLIARTKNNRFLNLKNSQTKEIPQQDFSNQNQFDLKNLFEYC